MRQKDTGGAIQVAMKRWKNRGFVQLLASSGLLVSQANNSSAELSSHISFLVNAHDGQIRMKHHIAFVSSVFSPSFKGFRSWRSGLRVECRAAKQRRICVTSSALSSHFRLTVNKRGDLAANLPEHWEKNLSNIQIITKILIVISQQNIFRIYRFFQILKYYFDLKKHYLRF